MACSVAVFHGDEQLPLPIGVAAAEGVGDTADDGPR